MAIELIKVDLTDDLGSPWNISQNQIAPYNKSSEKIFHHKTLSPSNVYYMEFYRIFLIEYIRLIGIVSPTFARRK